MGNLARRTLIALMVFTAPLAVAAAPAWPRGPASDVSLFMALQRFRIHADRCSSTMPESAPAFATLMGNLDGHLQRISRELLAADEFRDMQQMPVPATIIDGLKDSFEDLKHNIERRDATSTCQDALRELRAMDDDALRAALRQALTAVQAMVRNVGRER
jgi:hypothetical protein